MRHILIAAAAIAVSGLLASSGVRAETPFNAGGPAKTGQQCKVITDDGAEMYGYYANCPPGSTPVARQIKKKKMNKS
jgi:hypothetical protein